MVPSIIALGKAICVFPLLVLAGHFRPIDLALPSFIEAPVWEQYMRCPLAHPPKLAGCCLLAGPDHVLVHRILHPRRIGRFYLHVSLMRTKYYFGWFLAESSCIASGFGYSGKDKRGNIKWCVVPSLPRWGALEPLTSYVAHHPLSTLQGPCGQRVPSGCRVRAQHSRHHRQLESGHCHMAQALYAPQCRAVLALALSYH